MNKAVEEGWSETMTAVSQTKNFGRENLINSPLLHFLLSLLDHSVLVSRKMSHTLSLF